MVLGNGSLEGGQERSRGFQGMCPCEAGRVGLVVLGNGSVGCGQSRRLGS